MKIINFSALIARVIYLLLGLLNTFIFLLATILISLYFYFLWLKFRYFNDYDFLQQINMYTLIMFSFFNYFLIIYDKIYFAFAFTINISVLGLTIGFIPYLGYKKKALDYRYRAIEELRKNNYNKGCELLQLGINFAKKMLKFITGYLNPPSLSKLSKKMISELKHLESSEPNKLNLEIIFSEPNITKLDIKKYILWLCFIFLSIFFLFVLPILLY
ncbi:MAG: hypothetical protein ACFFDN_01020 [Candidatus Hodarchaeota archaeon]